jgi:hypothetical protein
MKLMDVNYSRNCNVKHLLPSASLSACGRENILLASLCRPVRNDRSRAKLIRKVNELRMSEISMGNNKSAILEEHSGASAVRARLPAAVGHLDFYRRYQA